MLIERDFLEDLEYDNITIEFASHSSLHLIGNYLPIDTPRIYEENNEIK